MQSWEELAYARQDGKAEGKAEAILELLEDAGSVPSGLREEIMAEQDDGKLRKWLKLAARAGEYRGIYGRNGAGVKWAVGFSDLV